jgi:hypothetical protein
MKKLAFEISGDFVPLLDVDERASLASGYVLT